MKELRYFQRLVREPLLQKQRASASPGFRLNIGKSGVGASWGVEGFPRRHRPARPNPESAYGTAVTDEPNGIRIPAKLLGFSGSPDHVVVVHDYFNRTMGRDVPYPPPDVAASLTSRHGSLPTPDAPGASPPDAGKGAARAQRPHGWLRVDAGSFPLTNVDTRATSVTANHSMTVPCCTGLTAPQLPGPEPKVDDTRRGRRDRAPDLKDARGRRGPGTLPKPWYWTYVGAAVGTQPCCGCILGRRSASCTGRRRNSRRARSAPRSGGARTPGRQWSFPRRSWRGRCNPAWSSESYQTASTAWGPFWLLKIPKVVVSWYWLGPVRAHG